MIAAGVGRPPPNRRGVAQSAALIAAWVALTTLARADDPAANALPSGAPPTAPAARSKPAATTAIADGDDLIGAVPDVARMDFGWSIGMTLTWGFAGGYLQAPQLDGLFALLATRVLYGTSWSLMLVSEVALMRRLGGGLGFADEAKWVSDRLFGYAVPAGCDRPGAHGGCGLGTGGFAELRLHLARSPFWFALGGGSVLGRVETSRRRVLSEATWVLSPASIVLAVAPRLGPFELRLALGPGVYFGLHDAHVQPRPGYEYRVGAPWHSILPLDGGVGAGGRAEIGLGFPGDVRASVEAVVAPFAGPSGTPDLAAPIDRPRGDGPNVWRSGSVGVSAPLGGMRLGLRWWGAELSPRALPAMGHRGALVRWEIPLRGVGDSW